MAKLAATVPSLDAVPEPLRELYVQGGEAIYADDTPMNDRTAATCMKAPTAGRMALSEWSASRFLRPLHLCRCVLVGRRAEWFAECPVAGLGCYLGHHRRTSPSGRPARLDARVAAGGQQAGRVRECRRLDRVLPEGAQVIS